MSKVLIVGGGAIGLSIARELKKKGVEQITILERNAIGREASYAAGGMLAVHAETNKIDDFFHFCSESLKLYPGFADQLLEETDIDIELDREGTLYLAFSEDDLIEIDERFKWQKKAGLEVESLSPTEIHKFEPFVSPDVLGGLFFPEDWQVENRRLLYALEKFAVLQGVEIIPQCNVLKLIFQNGKITGVETEKEKFLADCVVLATGAWTSLIKTDGFFVPSIKPLRGQMINFHTAKRLFSKVIYSPRGYLVPRRDGRILAGATTEDAGYDQTISSMASDILRETALEIAPSLVGLEIIDSWVGLRPFAADEFPVLGEIAENLFIATAHYRNGILLTPITAKIMAEKIVDNTNSRYLNNFSPERFQKSDADKKGEANPEILNR